MYTSKLLPLAILLVSTTSFAAGNQDHDHHASSNQMDHSQMDHGDMASAVGMPAPAAQASQTYHVTLTDDMKMQFSPALSIKQGEVVRFIVTNKGKIAHEFSIGSLDEQKKHREMMQAMPNMTHDDGTTITLAPGATTEMGWHFMGLNFVEFACNIPGHSEAGMKRNTVLR